jgi:hypothetical protein
MLTKKQIARLRREGLFPKVKKVKQLRYWNGRGHGKYKDHHLNVAAYTKRQAAQLIAAAAHGEENLNTPYYVNSYTRELNIYYFECWGNDMKGVVVSVPSVFATKGYGDEREFELVYEIK